MIMGNTMNSRAALIWLFVMACLISVMAYLFLREGGSDIGPRYTLESFKRQWNVNSFNPKGGLAAGQETPDGWFADYGDGVTLLILMRGDVVTGVRIRYEGRPEQGAGGPRFLLLMQTAINVGTFRWPQERIDEVRQGFSHMSPMPKDYRHMYSAFSRSYTPGPGWEFTLDFVPISGSEKP